VAFSNDMIGKWPFDYKPSQPRPVLFDLFFEAEQQF